MKRSSSPGARPSSRFSSRPLSAASPQIHLVDGPGARARNSRFSLTAFPRSSPGPSSIRPTAERSCSEGCRRRQGNQPAVSLRPDHGRHHADHGWQVPLRHAGLVAPGQMDRLRLHRTKRPRSRSVRDATGRPEIGQTRGELPGTWEVLDLVSGDGARYWRWNKSATPRPISGESTSRAVSRSR